VSATGVPRKPAGSRYVSALTNQPTKTKAVARLERYFPSTFSALGDIQDLHRFLFILDASHIVWRAAGNSDIPARPGARLKTRADRNIRAPEQCALRPFIRFTAGQADSLTALASSSGAGLSVPQPW